MKKILFSACAIALMATSCGNKANNAASTGDKAFGDSVATALGHAAGAREFQQFERVQERMSEQDKANFKKDEFMRGLELVLTSDTANIAFLNGLYTGLNLFNPVVGFSKESGDPVDPKLVIKAFREVYMADSLPNAEQYQMQYQQLMQEMQRRVEEHQKELKAKAPEATKNLKNGKQYADKMMSNGFKKSDSGLVYNITNPGTGDKIKPEDRVKITYTGKHIDGKVFDESSKEGYTATARGFVPGFTEGLQLLAKGGTATLVIPADLAYGLDGVGNGTIGPNETLVFEVQILDVNPATPAK